MAGAKDIMYAFAAGSACMGGILCLQHYTMRYRARNNITQKLGSAAADEAAQQIDENLAGCTLVASDGSKFILSEPITAAHSKVLGAMFDDIQTGKSLISLEDSSDEVGCLADHVNGKGVRIDDKTLLPCSRMAHKYDMPQLQSAVDDYVDHLALSDTNVVSLFSKAHDNPGLNALKDRCILYWARHLDRICNGRWIWSLLQLAQDGLMHHARLRWLLGSFDVVLITSPPTNHIAAGCLALLTMFLPPGYRVRHPTEWLEALPQSTLLDLMQCRCRYLCAAARICEKREECVVNLKALTSHEITQLEHQIIS